MADQLAFRFDALVPPKQDPLRYLAVARQVLEAYDAAIRSGNTDEAERQAGHLRNLAIDLNGGTSRGMAVDNGGLVQLDRALRATDTLPMWGQSGMFTVVLQAGCLVRVEYAGLTRGTAHHCFGAHVVEVDKPFLSETGYRHFVPFDADFPPPPGSVVPLWCTQVMEAYVQSADKASRKKSGLVPLLPEYQARRKQELADLS